MEIQAVIQILVAILAGVVLAIVQRKVLRKTRIDKKDTRTASHKNIGTSGRLLRLCIAVVLLVYTVLTGSLIAALFTGYTFYEALAKWCGLYAVLGKNSCPLE